MSVFNPSDVYVIIPAYNEATVLKETLSDIVRYGYNIAVIDDGSVDDTASIAASFPVHVLRHIVNLGQGAGLTTGIEYALQQGAKYIVTFDADGQHDAKDIAKLVEPLAMNKAEAVLGSRFLDRQSSVPLSRRIVLKLGIVYARLETGVWFTDVYNGLRGFTADAARKLAIRQPRMGHGLEILSKIARLGLRYIEVPVLIRYSVYSRRKGLKAIDALDIVIDVLEGRLR